MDNCSFKAVSLMFLLLPFLFSSFARKRIDCCLIIQKNSLWDAKAFALIINVDVDYVDNKFRANENEAVQTHMPRHRDSKTKKPRHWDSKTRKPQRRDFKTKKPRNQDQGTKTPRHRETETIKPRHRDSKTFFQRTKSHDIEIPRLKNHGIEIPRLKSHNIKFLWNSDPYAPLMSIFRSAPLRILALSRARLRIKSYFNWNQTVPTGVRFYTKPGSG